MTTRRTIILSAVAALAAVPAAAQFTGPSVQGQQSTVAAARESRVGSYVTLQGNLVAHLRSDYYTFRDSTGEIRVEIPAAAFGGRQIGPSDTVRIMGEVDTGRWGRYVWVKSLQTV